MNPKKGKGLKVKQTGWTEFLHNQGKGFHIAEHLWFPYVKMIKTYHMHGFKDSKESQNSFIPRDSNCLIEHPRQSMTHPSKVDVRQLLNNIKSRKRKNYGKVVLQDEVNDMERKKQLLTSQASIEEQRKRKQTLAEGSRRPDEWEKTEGTKEQEVIKFEKEMAAKEKELELKEELNLLKEKESLSKERPTSRREKPEWILKESRKS